jgi:hypothetical protein
MCPSISPSDHARLTDAAKRQASSLRDQAISDFWRQAGLAIRRALMAAHRLARSPARHGQSGKQQGA